MDWIGPKEFGERAGCSRDTVVDATRPGRELASIHRRTAQGRHLLDWDRAPASWRPFRPRASQRADTGGRDDLVGLTQGMVARIDPADAGRVAELEWLAERRRDGTWVAKAWLPKGRARSSVSLGRWILQPDEDRIVWYANGDRLDCRRTNIAAVTAAQRARLVADSHEKPNALPYRGVYDRARWTPYGSKPRDRKRYIARVTVDGRRHYLGSYTDVESAARAYDDAVLQLVGPDAPTNFPRDP